MKTIFLKGGIYKDFGKKTSNGATNFGNKSTPIKNKNRMIQKMDNSTPKASALER